MGGFGLESGNVASELRRRRYVILLKIQFQPPLRLETSSKSTFIHGDLINQLLLLKTGILSYLLCILDRRKREELCQLIRQSEQSRSCLTPKRIPGLETLHLQYSQQLAGKINSNVFNCCVKKPHYELVSEVIHKFPERVMMSIFGQQQNNDKKY